MGKEKNDTTDRSLDNSSVTDPGDEPQSKTRRDSGIPVDPDAPATNSPVQPGEEE